MSNESRIDLKITSSARCLAAVRGAVEELARVEGFSEMDSHALVLALDEALANVIEHGYGGQPGHPIEITLMPVRASDDRAGVCVTVRDQGKQVDPTKICGRDLDDVRPGGLGVHIIRSVMEEVEYSCPIEGGMLLRMVKYASAEPTASPESEPIGDAERRATGREGEVL